MQLKTVCPRCGRTYQVADDHHGRRLRCSQCGETFTLTVSMDDTRGSPPKPDPPLPKVTPSQGLREGQRLGVYEIVRKLGAGAMGEVWLAQDTTLDRPVAIKVLPAEFARDESRLARFLREAKAAAGPGRPPSRSSGSEPRSSLRGRANARTTHPT